MSEQPAPITTEGCPVCGAPCVVAGDDREGTHHYLPILPDSLDAARDQLEVVLPDGWTWTVHRMSAHRYMAWAEPSHDRNARIVSHTTPAPVAAVRALIAALGERL